MSTIRSSITSPSRSAGRGIAAPRQRGSAAVEAALLLPIFVLLTLMTMEGGIFFWNATHSQNAVAAGARTGVSQSRTPSYEVGVLESVAASLRMIQAEPLSMTIFKADRLTGRPAGGATGNDFSTCAADCFQYRWDAATGWEPVGSSTWPAAEQAACGPLGSTDFLGVQVRLVNRSVTGFVLRDKVITSSSVMRLEPVSTSGGNACAPDPSTS